jgi:hypothetical protein
MPPRHILKGYFEIAIARRILSSSVSLSCGFLPPRHQSRPSVPRDKGPPLCPRRRPVE